jgi:surfactin synthase thioesterase subunit
MDELTDRLVAELLPHLGPRFALFGHSLGALVAFSLCRSLEALGRAPAHLFLSGAGAPHCGTDGAAVSTLPDDALIAHVRRLGGLPSEVLEYDELVALLLPVMRDDFELAESYRPLDRHRLTTPVTALAGLDDRTAPPPAVRAWRDLVDGPFDVVVLPGAHFFVLEHEAEVLATIQTRLRPDVRVLRRRHDIEGDH